jgi:hypothetical protein
MTTVLENVDGAYEDLVAAMEENDELRAYEAFEELRKRVESTHLIFVGGSLIDLSRAELFLSPAQERQARKQGFDVLVEIQVAGLADRLPNLEHGREIQRLGSRVPLFFKGKTLVLYGAERVQKYGVEEKREVAFLNWNGEYMVLGWMPLEFIFDEDRVALLLPK